MNPDENLQRFRAVVAYDGTEFAGFQAQEHVGGPVRTVQAALEHAVLLATGYAARVVGAGRTDRGVHASGQVVHFDLPVPCALRGTGMISALNSRLPPDLRVLMIEPVSADFHAAPVQCDEPLLPVHHRELGGRFANEPSISLERPPSA